MLESSQMPLRTLPIFVTAALFSGLGGCDRVSLEENPSGGVDAEFHSRAIRTRLTNEGLASLFEVTHPDGLAVGQSAQRRTLQGTRLSVGPLSQDVAVDQIRVSVDGTELDLTLETGPTRVTIPVRVEQQAGTRICRFRLEANDWTVEARSHDDAGKGWSLVLAEPPTFDTTRLRASPVGGCPELLDDGEVPSKLSRILTNYLGTAVASGMEAFIDVPVYENVGLPRGRVSLRHVSSFRNRRGRLDIEGSPPETQSISLGDSGLSAALDVATSFQRADCVAPQKFPEPSDASAGTVDASEVQKEGGEVGLALAGPLVERLVQSAILAGFGCRGLDSATSESDSRSIGRQNLGLATVGLADAPVSGPFQPAIGPGSPPEIDLRPETNSIALRWERLTVDLYGTRGGAPLKLLSLTTTATFTLRPTDGSGSTLPFEIRAISVEDASIASPWETDPPEASTLQRWARRLLLITFEDAFDLPLPVTPETPLESTGSRVRSGDLLVVLRYRSG